MSEILQPLRFCGSVHCTIYMYLYLYSYRRETARQLRMYAQLTRCFSAVAELLVTFTSDHDFLVSCVSMFGRSARDFHPLYTLVYVADRQQFVRL